ncbi:unnamed protein product [Ambrosiozyma monospora]|uniref:Unnamed protein product n=1 Tax=Ambrosiozyma monospora TaxID=43982 RepID=A0ACB5TAG3_AMBMO|nr:unnamed protein product [Ambrosiozyma monospora]
MRILDIITRKLSSHHSESPQEPKTSSSQITLTGRFHDDISNEEQGWTTEESNRRLEISTSNEAMNEFPEGGTRAWLVCAAASIILSFTFGMVNSYGVYQSYYESTYPHVSSNTLSIIGSLQSCFTLVFALPSTVAMYYVGTRPLVFVGGFIMCLSYFMLSLQNSVSQVFVIQGLMFGLGSGVAYVHATTVLFQYFDKKKALVQGIQTAVAAVAGVYWPIAARGLIDTVGYRWSNRVIGFIYIPFMLIASVLLKPRLTPPKRKPGQNFLRVNFKVLLDYKFMTINLCWMMYIMALFPGLFYIDLFCQHLMS